MEGNVLYEWSQLLAAAGAEWRPTLDGAVERFRGAACSEADVRSALKNHTRAAELDLGPDPEEEAAKAKAAEQEAAAAAAAAEAEAAAAAAAAKQQPEKAKGLPSLGRKKP
jgi:hypothetical protein